MQSLLMINSNAEMDAIMGIIMAFFIAIVVILVAAIKALIFCKIFSKAGYSWALGLLMIVPVADIIMACVLAFGRWPILKEVETLKARK